MLSLEDAVLVAVLKGTNDPKKVSSVLKVKLSEVEKILKNLEEKGLVKIEESKKLFFKSKKIYLTPKGNDKALKALKELENLAKSIKDSTKPISFSEIHYLLPLLLWLGLIDSFHPTFGEFSPDFAGFDL
ncbi:MAG: hypothetical protein NZ895_01320 [Archaeoglobaceae archaeon]|nr:hypothetical protein [Archaeoglobaceae archaeon]MCX8151677.1 hypothetical protein [Archaeoglobaceae archaeon]MDW8013045.1 helix-turn-helix domain-containing protein [Archaeoglobaceae archaeon]